ncbi:MAG: mannose-6-phosphate isomerase, class I [Spirochaetales bacterium]|nr:mannose-6-phosphate isomerase, class I [Spirochaetales bacterium]
MADIFVLHNTIQEYAWGSRSYISMLLGRNIPSPRPEAELWMGAHPRGPSKVTQDNGEVSLIDVIESDPEGILGEYVVQRFDKKLPFLFKVLASEKPLSIQAHPDRVQAEEGFRRENEKGIPLDAPYRVYRDKNHKPEIICALTPFWALNGFRPIHDITDTIRKTGSAALMSRLDLIECGREESGLKAFFRSIMTMGDDEKREAIEAVHAFARANADNSPSCRWICDIFREYPSDTGIFAVLLLNLVNLKPGEAMFLPACRLHSYLNGVGIELMANSDNVLRGGLTPKHIDIPELCNIIDFREHPVSILRPRQNRNHEKRYATPAEEFLLSSCAVTPGRPYRSPADRSIEIIICTEGNASVRGSDDEREIPMRRGRSILIPARLRRYEISGNALLYKAAVPLPC